MRSFAIHIVNASWLVIVLIGVPAATSIQVGKLGLSAVPEFRMLTLGGLAVGAAGNLLWACLTSGKACKVCWNWTFVYGAALTVYLLVFNGYIHFRWLKDTLLWLKKTAM